MDAKRLAMICLIGLVAIVVGLYAESGIQMYEEYRDSSGAKVTDDDEEADYYIPFGRITVNLNEDMLTYTFTLDLTLETVVGNDAADDVRKALKQKKPILRSWLTETLADKRADDLRGAAGVRGLRREILDKFRLLLFDDPAMRDELVNVHFDEYRVNRLD